MVSSAKSHLRIKICQLTVVLHEPHLDGLVPRSVQTPEQHPGIEPVHGTAEQEPQNLGSLATFVHVPLQQVG